MQNIIKQTEEYVKNELFKEASGHDWYHTERVRNVAKKIAIHENANIFVVELASLLHDIGDYKLHNGDETIARKLIMKWLTKLNVEKLQIENIIDIIENISFSKSLNKSVDDLNKLSIEAKIVCDADRLDAIGAVGIARTFAFGGYFKRIMYDPNITPKENLTSEEYKKSESTTINHFYEKLLKLKDKMFTETGKKMAEERHYFMLKFLEQFYLEFDGSC